MRHYTPSSVVGGCLPVGSPDPLEAAYHAAATALDTEAVHLVSTVLEGHVYYLAAPSAAFASTPDAGTPLAAALPGHPAYLGAGVYLADTPDGLVYVVSRPEYLGVYAGDVPEPDALPLHDLRDLDGESWRPYRLAQERAERQHSQRLAHLGFAAIAAGLVLWAGLVLANGWLSTKEAQAHHAALRQMEQVAGQIDTRQPALMQLAGLQHVASTVMRGGGWIEFYRIETGGAPRWSAVLPAWITGDYLIQLGNAKAERHPENPSLIKVGIGDVE